MIEAIATVLHDTPIGRKISRMLIAFIVCLVGCMGSLAFCSDIGYILLDVVDHYVNTYTMLGLGILQCLAIGWIYEVQDIKKKVPLRSILTYTIGFWFLIILLPLVSIFAYHTFAWTTILVILALMP